MSTLPTAMSSQSPGTAEKLWITIPWHTAKSQLFTVDQARWAICHELFWTKSVTYDCFSPQTVNKPKQLCPRLLCGAQGQGLLKLLRDTGLVLTESCHICAGHQNPQQQLEKQHYGRSLAESRRCLQDQALRLLSTQIICWLCLKKGKLQFNVPSTLPCSWSINHNQYEASVLSGMCMHRYCYFLRSAALFHPVTQEQCWISFLSSSSYQGKWLWDGQD